MHRRRHLSWLVPLALLVALPGPALAAPPDGSCAAERSVAHTMPVPADLRTPGVHRYERRFTYRLTDGTTLDGGTAAAEVEITADAPGYRNVLLRVIRVAGLSADGTIATITAMRPDQVAAFYSQIAWLKGDPVDTVVEELRYETRRNHWTAWQVVAAGPVVSLCVEAQDAIFLKRFGWAR